MITRDNIFDALIPHFYKDPRYYLLICDCGFAKIDKITSRFPDRVINCGIMEQATVGIASGMAQSGLIPIIYSIAAFIVYRALEQLRLDVVLRKQNVKIIGNGSGDYFKFLDEIHWMRDHDRRIFDVIELPVYTGEQFDDWLYSQKGGYIIC